MNYQLLKDLLPLLESYAQAAGNDIETNQSVNGFLNWAINMKKDEPSSAIEEPKLRQPVEFGYSPMENIPILIPRLATLIYRYVRMYIKKTLEGMPISTPEEFAILATAFQEPGKSKSHLFEKSALDKPTGHDIINRLIKDGLLVQRASEDDKRSKAIFISAEGEALMWMMVQRMQPLQQIVIGDLDGQEQLMLFNLLQRLHLFHHPIYESHRDNDWAVLQAAVAGR